MTSRREPASGLFFTGTNTGVGKTYVAAAVARELVRQGLRVGVYKPVLSGSHAAIAGDSPPAIEEPCDDDQILWHAAACPGEFERVCPQRFRAPIAPHLAAREEGREVDPQLLRSGIDYWRERSDLVLVEGAGGWLSPLTDHEYVADLAQELGFPVVIVAANQLGVINQTLLTLQSICGAGQSIRGAGRPQLKIAAIVLNDPPPAAQAADASVRSNRQELQRRCGDIPLLELRWQQSRFDTAIDWRAWSRA